MGLIQAAMGAAGGVLADQWREYFYCESIPESVMAVKGQRRVWAGGATRALTTSSPTAPSSRWPTDSA